MMKQTHATRRIVSVLTAGLLLGMLIPAPPAAAVEPRLDTVPQQVFAPGAAPGDEFGGIVDVWGDTAIVGTMGAGPVWVFRRLGAWWFPEQELVPNDGPPVWFGTAVAIQGDTAIVGALGDSTSVSFGGAAYVFTRSAGGLWSQQDKLMPSDPAYDGQFGRAVDIDGNTAFVGAFGSTLRNGAVYVFTRSGSDWTERTKLTPSDATLGQYFGNEVALDGDTALIGAVEDDEKGPRAGAAYVFTGSGASWQQQKKLFASDPMDLAQFGGDVALQDGTALVGASHADDQRGSVHVFTGSGSSWTHRAKLVASDRSTACEFGMSVSLSGGTALVGAYREDRAAQNMGSAYLFTGAGSTWTERAKLTASDAAADDYFGYSVAISGGTALAGVRWDDTLAGNDAGSAWFYSFRHPVTPGVVRIAGANRYATSVASAKRGFPAGAPAVVVATGTNWPDALGGSALAGAAHGPLLLTRKDALPSEVATEIRRLGAVKAYVLGSSAAVGPAVESTLVSMLGRSNVIRLGGPDRYVTAHLVSEEAMRLLSFTFTGTVIVTTGRNYPDATAASPVAALLGAPVLLVNPSQAEVALPPGTQKAVVLGSTAAVPAAIETYLVDRLGRDNVYREGGANRYATACQLAFLSSFFGVKAETTGLATGTNFPDALTAGPLLARSASPLLLTRPTALPGETKALLQAAAPQVKSLVIFGDYNAVSAAVEAQARAAAGL